jgi:hypothetical protein
LLLLLFFCCLLIMKIFTTSLVHLLLLPSVVEAVFQPVRISFESLLKSSDADSNRILLTQLREVGMISISDIPAFDKTKVMASLAACTNARGGLEHVFEDGTLRRTLASRSLEGEAEPFLEESCPRVDPESCEFRQTVASVTHAFAEKLATALELQHEPLLRTYTSSSSYTLTEIVDHGEHLEHLHAYYQEQPVSDDIATLDWHIDQGLFLVFAPGTIDGVPTEGFYIQLPDGTTEKVKFDNQDDLVIFLGDGVNQFVNPTLKEPLRVLPHALRMPQTKPNAPRTWYGRMVLAPANALHPLFETTYGELRDAMIHEETNKDGVMALGCSSSNMMARFLHAGESHCDPSRAAACWHSCMNYTDYNVSPDICAARGLELACANPQGEIWPGSIHNRTFTLRCAAKNAPVFVPPATAAPTAAPAPAGICFSGDVTVQVKNVGTRALKDVELGDEILVAIHPDGTSQYEAIYSFGHKNAHVLADYLSIATDGASALEISSRHMMQVEAHRFLPASMLKVGDKIQTATGDEVVITSIVPVQRHGAYAPFTASGKLVVNKNLVASNYIAYQDSEHLVLGGFQTGWSFQWLAHTFVVLRRWLLGTSERYTNEGVVQWVHGPHQVASWMLEQPTFVALTLLPPVVAVFGFLSWMQTVMQNPWLLVAALVVVMVAVTRKTVTIKWMRKNM